MHGIAYNSLWGVVISSANYFHRATKILFDRSFRKLVKECFGSGFFKLVHCFKNSITCLNIAQ